MQRREWQQLSRGLRHTTTTNTNSHLRAVFQLDHYNEPDYIFLFSMCANVSPHKRQMQHRSVAEQ